MRIHHNRLSLIDRRLWRGEEFRIGLRDMFAASPGIAAWALVTGVAMAKSGLDMSTVVAMSALVFAASAQLAAMPLMLPGTSLVIFGDGHVEIEEARAVGAYAVAVCSDENDWRSRKLDAPKQARLTSAGAHFCVPDFVESADWVSRLPWAV